MTTFGYMNIGVSNNSEANYIRGTKFPCSGVGVTSSITVRLENVGYGGHAKCALYLGSDRSLVAVTEELTFASDFTSNWYTFNFPSPPSLTAQDYWVVVYTDFIVWRRYDADANFHGTSWYIGSYGDFPATLTDTGNNRKFSIYASYTEEATNISVTDTIAAAEGMLTDKALVQTDAVCSADGFLLDWALVVGDGVFAAEAVEVGKVDRQTRLFLVLGDVSIQLTPRSSS